MPHRPDPSVVAEVVPPRGLTDSMGAARAMLGALAGDFITLEIVVGRTGPRWLVRAANDEQLERALTQLRAAYPLAVVEQGHADPAVAVAGEHAVAVELRPAADRALALRLDWRAEHDPLAGVVAAAEAPGDERVVCRLTLSQASAREADAIRGREERPVSTRREHDRGPVPGFVSLVVLAALVALLQLREWYESGEWMLLARAGGVTALGVPAAVVLTRLLRRGAPLTRTQVAAKLATPLVHAHLSVIAVGRDASRLRGVASRVAAAYAAYDSPDGGGLRAAKARRAGRGGRPVGRPLLLSTAEAAALWHLPNAEDTPPRTRRTTAQRLAPAPGHATHGVHLGVAPVGPEPVPVFMPEPLLHRNQLLVAKTRRGKSTALRHLAAGLMERVAAGVEDTALVVVDPHQDLAESVLASVPAELADRTVYLDFAHLSQPIGLNLLDVRLFPDRDRAVEHIVVLMNRLWPENWGPRMEGALRASLASLHEMNTRRAPEEQYTLLDVAPMLMKDSFRQEILDQVRDNAVVAWWRHNYNGVNPTLRQQTANPVSSKIGRFTVTEAARLVLGQPRSTFDPRSIVRDGGVAAINTAVGVLGEGASQLIGATFINLLGLLIEEQVELPPEQRRRVVVLVDESSTLGAIDYTRALSELNKYGASFVLSTQSLAKLDAISRELVPTILANSDGLTVFQVSAEDARRLLPELGSGLEVEDLVSLDDFSAYARWWDGYARPPAFTLRVDPPPATDLERMREIAARSAQRHGRPREQVQAEISAILAERLAPDPEDRRERRKKDRPDQPSATPASSASATATQSSEDSDPPESAEAGAPPARGNQQRSPK